MGSASPPWARAAWPAADGPRWPGLESAAWTTAMAVAVGLSLVGLHANGPAPYLALDVAVGCASVGLVPFLARWPVTVTVVLSALAALSLAATPPATMAVFLVARWRRLAIASEVAVAGVAAHLIRELWRPYPGVPFAWWTVLACVSYAGLVGWGTLIRANRALIASLLERAEQAEAEQARRVAEQARRVAEARRGERARIAREMHDVLAHRLSLLATYAGALSYHPGAPPEQLSKAAEVIRAGAHQALEELREVIIVLREDSAAGPLAGPLPGIADLPELIEETRAAGTPVSVAGSASSLSDAPDSIGRVVYRVVQEGLTNARKHAPGSPVRITFGGAPGAGAEVDIVNSLPAAPGGAPASGGASGAGPVVPGTGTGLIGLAERLDLAGGRLEAGQRSGGGPGSGSGGGEFRLHAWLPWPETQPETQPERQPETQPERQPERPPQ